MTASTLASALMIVSATILFLLGAAHLVLTFRGRNLRPRESDLEARMREVSPVITSETTMWDAWIGFNASHSFGAILFGLVYGYLGLVHTDVIFGSWFLLATGLALLGGFVFLGWRYWFSVPFRGILLSTALYVLALALNFGTRA